MGDPNIRQLFDRAVGPTPVLEDPMPAIWSRARARRLRRRSAAVLGGAAAIAGIVVAGLALTGPSTTARSSVVVVGPGPAVQAGAEIAPVTADGMTLSVTTDPAVPLAGTQFDLLVHVSGARTASIAGLSSGTGPGTAESIPSNALGLLGWLNFFIPRGQPSAGCPIDTCMTWLVDQPAVVQVDDFAVNAISAETGRHVTLSTEGTIGVGRPASYASLTVTVDPGTPRSGQAATIITTVRGGPGSSVSFRVDFGDGNITGTGPKDCSLNYETPASATPIANQTAVTERFRHAWTDPGAYHLSVAAFENGGCVTAAGYAAQNVTITVK